MGRTRKTQEEKAREEKNKRPRLWKPYIKLIGHAERNNSEYPVKHQRPTRKPKTKQLEYATHRKTLIIMEDGHRTLNIASLNPDSMRAREMQQEIVKSLTENEIHLSEIQETHITRACSYILDNYRIITSSGRAKKLESPQGHCNRDT